MNKLVKLDPFVNNYLESRINLVAELNQRKPSGYLKMRAQEIEHYLQGELFPGNYQFGELLDMFFERVQYEMSPEKEMQDILFLEEDEI